MGYDLKETNISAYEGDDIGVFDTHTNQFVKTFNTLSNDYAYTSALEHISMLEKRHNGTINSNRNIKQSSNWQ